VHRQLSLLDVMERKRDIDPKDLEELFRLDHLATRMRRNAENLIVLSGAIPARGWRRSVPMVDVVRAAVGEVEDYTRVQVLPFGPVELAGRAVGDLTHLLAELIENAVSFSPPDTVVQIGGHMVANGFAIDIEDRGLGMSEDRLAQLNVQIARPPEFNLQSSVQLGLFVVGKLAERYGLHVMLKRSAYGGTTAVVVIPRELVVQDPSQRPAEPRELPSDADQPPATRDGPRPVLAGTTTENGLAVRQPTMVGAAPPQPGATGTPGPSGGRPGQTPSLVAVPDPRDSGGHALPTPGDGGGPQVTPPPEAGRPATPPSRDHGGNAGAASRDASGNAAPASREATGNPAPSSRDTGERPASPSPGTGGNQAPSSHDAWGHPPSGPSRTRPSPSAPEGPAGTGGFPGSPPSPQRPAGGSNGATGTVGTPETSSTSSAPSTTGPHTVPGTPDRGEAGGGRAGVPNGVGGDRPERPETALPEDLPPVPDIDSTPSGLPVRVPQANLAPPLRAKEPLTAQPEAEAEPEQGRSPAEIQRIMGSYQRGTRRGRTDAARALGRDASEGEENQ
jgi:hypothetical protein